MKKQQYYFILTFGCQMNKNDSERLAGVLEGMGLEETNSPEAADVLFMNTCSVRQHAEDRVWGFMENWQKLREKKKHLIIGITGCMPGRDKDGKLQKKLSGVDLFFPISELPKLSSRLQAINPQMFSQQFDSLEEYWQFTPKRQEIFRAFITIQNGCNNFCTYCVVPHARGREKNRPLLEIIVEVKKLAKEGCKEITLLGQVVNNYKLQNEEYGILNVKNTFKQKDDFAALLWELNQVEGVERINFTAADPQYFNDYQIQALTLSKVVNYLHLPVQSGDNDVLKRMNRKYTREYYLELIQKIRKVKPKIAIGTDIIVGFCGETEKQFQNTVDLFKQCDFDISYHAVYSQRSGTAAAKAFKDDVPLLEKKRRWQILQKIMEETVLRKNQKYLGQRVSILVDSAVGGGWLSGNTAEMKMARFMGNLSLNGKIVEAEVYQAEEWILWCKAV